MSQDTPRMRASWMMNCGMVMKDVGPYRRMTPSELGRDDFVQGRCCDPYRYDFMSEDDIDTYVEGYEVEHNDMQEFFV